MGFFRGSGGPWGAMLLFGTLSAQVLGADILQTNGFSSCLDNPVVQVQKMDIQFNKETNKLDFDVAGTNTKTQNVTASMLVTAYGKEVYHKDFNPCDPDSYVAQLCPGMFDAQGVVDFS